MRISDWSSDVCSSDLSGQRTPDFIDIHRALQIDAAHEHASIFDDLDHAGLFKLATGLADRAAAYPESLSKREFVDTLAGLQISAQYHSFDFFLKHGGERFRPPESQCGRISSEERSVGKECVSRCRYRGSR